jgi:hypothetical protein
MVVLSLIRGIRAVSIYGIIVISIDRFIALSSPVEYAMNKSKFGTKVSIFLYWFIGFTVGTVSFDWQKGIELNRCDFLGKVSRSYLIFYQLVTNFCPLLILILIYIAVHRNMMKVGNKMNLRNFIIIFLKVHMTHVCEKCVDLKSSSGECKIRRKEKEATVNIIAIVFSFLICRVVSFLLPSFSEQCTKPFSIDSL